MEIKVLGTGCPKCKALEQATRSAVEEMGISAEITKVEEITDIMGYGILRTPALVVNEKVAISGRVPTHAEIKEILTQNQ